MGKTNVTEIQRVQGTLMAMGTKLRGVKIEQDKMAKEIQELRGSLSSLYGAEATAKSDNELKWELEEQKRLEEEEKVKQAEITKKRREEEKKRLKEQQEKEEEERRIQESIIQAKEEEEAK